MFFNRLIKKTDEELMRLVQQRDGHAMTELYKRYSKKIVRYFYRMLWNDQAKAQDFLHDLFMKIIESPDRFHADRKFSTWLYSVANNMCKNEYRKQAFRKTVSENSSITDLAQIIQENHEHKEFAEALNSALNLLDEEDKNLYTLRFELDLSMDEMATILECPIGTVKSRVFYLKKKLAGKLYDYHPVNE